MDLEKQTPQRLDKDYDGERKVVTVLFADIVGSSALVADVDPEDANDLLLSVLQLMIDSVHRFGGTITQVLGDGVMALFGAPLAQEGHAIKACLAAETMHDMVEQTFSNRLSGADSPIMIRVGVSSGEVVTLPVENDLHVEYRAVGQTVHLAARMESLAKPGGTVITEETMRLVAAHVDVRPAGVYQMSNDSSSIDSYEIVGINFSDQSRNRFLRQSKSFFVGREKDFHALLESLNRAGNGSGQVALVTGDAGIGKSRLVYEFLDSVQGRGYNIMECGLLPVGLGKPFEPLACVVEKLIPNDNLHNERQLIEKVTASLVSYNVTEPLALPAVLDILGITSDASGWDGLDPPERLQISIETAVQIVLAESRRHPLILVLEDFHWADSETRLFIEELAWRLKSSRILLVVTCRSHHNDSWIQQIGVTNCSLQPLSPKYIELLLSAVLGSDPKLLEVKNLLLRKSEGNPFFLEECIHTLEETGALVGNPGSYTVAVPVTDLKIPTTVHNVLAARIDSLSSAERSTLLCAAVIGQSVDVSLLMNLVGTSRQTLLIHLSRLQSAGFLQRTRIVPNLEYSFCHALIHDVAYGTLLKRRRRELHARVLIAIGGRRTDQLPDKIEQLAHHAFHASTWPRTYAYCRKAGQRAQAKSRNKEAIDYFERAIHALEQSPVTLRNQQRSIDVRLDLVQSLFPLGEHDQVYRQLLAAEIVAKGLQDKRRLVNIASQMILYEWIRGNLDQAIKIGNSALNMASTLDDVDLKTQIATRLGSLIIDRGDYESACQLLAGAIEGMPDNISHKRFGLITVPSVSCRASLARSLGEMGRFSDAIRVGDEGIRIAEEVGHTFSQIYANLYVGNAFLRKGDFERSLPLLEAAFDLCEATRSKLLFPLSAASLGYAKVGIGEVELGLSLLQKATGNAGMESLRFQLSQQLAWLAEAYLLAGKIENAEESAKTALAIALQHGEKGDEAWALWLLAEIQETSKSSSDESAEKLFRKAQRIAISKHMAPLVAHCHFGLGKFYQRRGNIKLAGDELAEAVSRYNGLSMHRWLGIAKNQLQHELKLAKYSG